MDKNIRLQLEGKIIDILTEVEKIVTDQKPTGSFRMNNLIIMNDYIKISNIDKNNPFSCGRTKYTKMIEFTFDSKENKSPIKVHFTEGLDFNHTLTIYSLNNDIYNKVNDKLINIINNNVALKDESALNIINEFL